MRKSAHNPSNRTILSYRSRRNASRLLSCSAPLVFTDPDGENPFFGGTCFRVRFADRIYVVTARHCLPNRNIALEGTRLECATPEQTYLPLKSWHLFDTVVQEDNDCGDIAIFQVALERMKPEEISLVPAFDVEGSPLPELTIGGRLLIEGFPSHLQSMDCDMRQWLRVSEKLEARYEGLSEYQGTSKLSFLDAEKAADLDGFSGAPVFAFEQPDSKSIRSGFAGMMIRARYFIDASIIIQSLKRASEHDAEPILI